MARTAEMTRDKNRTPMQWTSHPNAGFSPMEVSTWLPVNPNYKNGINVRDQEQNPSSLLHYYKHLLRVRKSSSALKEGEYIPLHTEQKDYFAFVRQADKQSVLVILNFSKNHLELNFSTTKEVGGSNLKTLFSSAERRIEEISSTLKLNPFEVFIAEVVHSK